MTSLFRKILVASMTSFFREFFGGFLAGAPVVSSPSADRGVGGDYF